MTLPALVEADTSRLIVVLLGPGYGESVLVRVPGAPARWLVIDSLLDARADGGTTPVTDALKHFDAEPDLVLLTHPHADHAAGMSRLVETYEERARFGLLDADFASVASGRVQKAAEGVEVSNAIRAIERLPVERRWDLVGPPVALGDGEVDILHPQPTRLKELRAFASATPNDFSSVLRIRWRGRDVLLGADLERPEWSLLPMKDELAVANPVKVPHHGSGGATDTTWMGQRADAGNASRKFMLAPYNRNPKLPDLDDDDGLKAMLKEVDVVSVTALPYETSPQALGTQTLEAVITARDNAKATDLPPEFVPVTSPQVVLAPDDAWLMARLEEAGHCSIVRGSASLEFVVAGGA